MTHNKMLALFIGSLLFVFPTLVLPVKGETMIDLGSAPSPYPEAAAYNQQFEFLGNDPHTDDGVSFKPNILRWKAGKKS